MTRWVPGIVLVGLTLLVGSLRASDTPSLTVIKSESKLFAGQDHEGKVIATLARGEELKPLMQGVAGSTWYMVKTAKGIIGWIQAADVSSSNRVNEIFKDASLPNRSAGRDGEIGINVTPTAQVEANKENDKREAERRRTAENRDEQERKRDAQLEQEKIRAQAAIEAARIKAQGEVEAAKKRKPDVCVFCDWR